VGDEINIYQVRPCSYTVASLAMTKANNTRECQLTPVCGIILEQFNIAL